MYNGLNPARKLIYGLENFDKEDDVDITLDIDKTVHNISDGHTSDDEHYQNDKKTIEEAFETVDDILTTDLDNDGHTDIVDNNMLYITTRHVFLQQYARYKTEYIGHLNTIDYVIKSYRQGHIGQEAFFDSVKRALTGIVNIFGHLVNLLKTTIFHGWRDFKQGELSDYSDSNRLTMTRLYQSDIYYSLKKVVVPTPKGMHGTYAAALNSLDNFLNITNMVVRAAKMEAISEAILENAIKQNPGFSSHVHGSYAVFDNRDVLSAYNETTKFFRSNNSMNGEFGVLFSSQVEFEQVCKACMDGDAHLRSVASIHARLESTADNFSRLIDTKYNFSNRDLEDISRITRRFAECFDMYATVIQDRLRIDHNLTLVVQTIRDVGKY